MKWFRVIKQSFLENSLCRAYVNYLVTNVGQINDIEAGLLLLPNHLSYSNSFIVDSMAHLQLNYIMEVRPEGFEPTTSSLSRKRSKPTELRSQVHKNRIF